MPACFDDDPLIRVPEVVPELSTGGLLTMTWLEGKPAARLQGRRRSKTATPSRGRCSVPGGIRSATTASSTATRTSATTRSSRRDGRPAGINLLDYGCIRTFRTPFVQGVIDLYTGLLTGDRDLVVHAYETWGFRGLTNELIEAMNIWARFIYGPLLDDRERSIAEGTTPGEYGRHEAFTVHKILKEKGPVTVPREFVFMDRAAIGLGGVFLHLDARMNWYRLFNETIEGFDLDTVAPRQDRPSPPPACRCRKASEARAAWIRPRSVLIPAQRVGGAPPTRPLTSGTNPIQPHGYA